MQTSASATIMLFCS